MGRKIYKGEAHRMPSYVRVAYHQKRARTGKAATDSTRRLPPLSYGQSPRDAGHPLSVSCHFSHIVREEQMPAQRLAMRQVHEVLRLKWEQGLSDRKIAHSLGIRRALNTGGYP